VISLLVSEIRGEPSSELVGAEESMPHISSSRHYPELDGIRGLALLFVLVFHLSLDGPKNSFQYIADLGWCGVDLFFVLSGFLITGILIDAKGSDRYFREFFERRLRRIAPLYYVTVAVIFWFALPLARRLGSPAPWTAIPSGEQIWFWLPLANLHSAFGFFQGEPIGHFWSLAVEEQFYLVWPLVIFVCSRNALIRISGVLIALSFILRNLPLFLYVQFAWPQFLYRMTPFHMDGLAVGALIAALLRSPAPAHRIKRFAAPALGISFVLTAILILFTHQTDITDRSMVRFGYSAFAITSGFLILFARLYSGSPHVLAGFLRLAPLRSFGKYSYAIYVLHPLFAAQLRDAARSWMPHGYWPVISISLGLPLSWCAGRCSWHLLERRFQRSRRPRPGQIAATAEPLDSILATN
jgi:peptidoglycan/LPS O-acetylase OafA/YrhL